MPWIPVNENAGVGGRNEVRSRGDDPAIAAGGETDRARAIAPRRGGLEVDGDKGTHCASPYLTKDGKLAVKT